MSIQIFSYNTKFQFASKFTVHDDTLLGHLRQHIITDMRTHWHLPPDIVCDIVLMTHDEITLLPELDSVSIRVLKTAKIFPSQSRGSSITIMIIYSDILTDILMQYDALLPVSIKFHETRRYILIYIHHQQLLLPRTAYISNTYDTLGNDILTTAIQQFLYVKGELLCATSVSVYGIKFAPEMQLKEFLNINVDLLPCFDDTCPLIFDVHLDVLGG